MLDSAELSSSAYNLGVPHATGYPLYILLGKGFTYIPVGDVGYRLNLMSAVFSSGTITIVYLICLQISQRRTVALATAGFLAFSFYFWSSAVVAEVYSLHSLLTATVILMMLTWIRKPFPVFLYVAGLAWGLSLGNHLSAVFIAPSFAYILIVGILRNQIRWREISIFAFAFLMPLTIYAYLPLRYISDAVPYVMGNYDSQGQLIRLDHTSIRGIWETLTAKQFESLIFAHVGMDFIGQLGSMVTWLFGNFLGIGFIFGLVGFIRYFLDDKQGFIILLMPMVVYLLFFAGYGAIDKQSMLLPVYLIWSIWMAIGISYFLGMMDAREIKTLGRFLPLRLAGWMPRIPWQRAILLLLPIIALAVNFQFTDVSSETTVSDRSNDLLDSFRPNALVLARWPDEAPMTYLQIVEKVRPDVEIIDRFLISRSNERTLIQNNLDKRPVYVFGPMPKLESHHQVVEVTGGFDLGYLLISDRPKLANDS